MIEKKLGRIYNRAAFFDARAAAGYFGADIEVRCTGVEGGGGGAVHMSCQIHLKVSQSGSPTVQSVWELKVPPPFEIPCCDAI